MSKLIKFKKESREAIKKGVDILANVVKVTLGPKGRTVILDKGYGAPTVTKDGVTIAKEIELEDKFENVGAALVKEVASKTADIAGDGTTTATLLVQAIVSEGIAAIDSGADPINLKIGMDRAVEKVIENLEKNAKKIKNHKEVQEVASISANDVEMGKMIADVFEKVGKEGVVTVEESQTFGLSSELVEGLQFDRGYVSLYMMTNAERMEAVYENPYILITDKKISSIADILPVLEKLAKIGKKDLVIIADDVEGEALATLIVNKIRGVFNTLAVKAPGFGDRRKEMLEDIAIVTGGQMISEDLGIKLENIELNMLGEAGKIISTKDNTTIVDGKGTKGDIEKRIKQIRMQLSKATSEFDKEKLNERLAKLSGGVAVIKVGAATETELKEKKFRIEDAVAATRAAIDEGIVPGGGVALFEASRFEMKELKGVAMHGDQAKGIDIIKRALEQPIKTIAENAGKNSTEVFMAISDAEKGTGFNATTGKIENMVDKGIIDPVKVVKTALQNASSAASMILISEAVVVDKPEEKKETPPMGGMGGMGGMM